MCSAETLHNVKHILHAEECRRVGNASFWWDELVVVIAANYLVQCKRPWVHWRNTGENTDACNSTAEKIKCISSVLYVSACVDAFLRVAIILTDCALHVIFTTN